VGYVAPVTSRGALPGFRRVLFFATGLAVPLYAFPVFRAFGRPVDPATVLAALFVAASLLSHRRRSAVEWLWLAAAAAVPLLVLARPPDAFDRGSFRISTAHWYLLVAFFFSSLSLEATGKTRRRIVVWNVSGAALVALFALYQVVGTSRRWPGTGSILLPFQREPRRLTWIGGFLQEGSYTRPSSVFLEPAWMGGYLSWVLVLGLAVVLVAPRRARSGSRSFLVSGLAVILLAIAASVSWGAYVDLAVGAAAIAASLWLGRHSAFRPLGLLVVAAVLLVALAALSPPGRRATKAIWQRWEMLSRTPLEENVTEAERQDSSWLRVRNVAHTFRLFRDHAAVGIGLGQFAMYERSGGSSSPTFRDPWCGWVTIAAQMGVLGPLILLGAIVLPLRRLRKEGFAGFEGIAVPAILAIAVVQQLHTGSFLDLWWWYPVSVAAFLSGPSAAGA
jgi:hypothetical protein